MQKEESKYLIDKIREAEKEGIPHSDMAVLYRTANDAKSDDGDFAGISDSIERKESIQNIYDHLLQKSDKRYVRLALKCDRRLFWMS